MRQKGVPGIQREPEVLPPTACRDDTPTRQPVTEVGGTCQMSPHRTGMAYFHRRDPAAHDETFQPTTDHFDLGQFRHDRIRAR
jgi:hypothetical protein